MTNLKRIKIKNLFYSNDIIVDLSSKCAVLIGANGIGKTVTLKIIEDIFTGNYVDIIASPFESIEIVYLKSDKTHRLTMKYADFLPTKESVIEGFNSEMGALAEFDDQWTERFAHLIENLIEKNLYAEFLYCSYTRKDFSPAVKRLVGSFISEYELVERKWDSNAFLRIVEDHSGWSEFWGPVRFFKNAPAIHKFNRSILWFIRNDVFYFNLVYSYELENEYMFDSFFIDDEIKWAYSNMRIYAYKDFKRAIDTKDYDEHFFDRFKMETPFLDDQEGGMRKIEKKLMEDKKFCINQMLNLLYFDNSTVAEINKVATKYVMQYYFEMQNVHSEIENENERCAKEAKEQLTDEIREKYKLYIKPVLVRNSFFDIDDIDCYSEVYTIDSHVYPDQLPYDNRIPPEEIIKRRCLKLFIEEAYLIAGDPQKRSEKIEKYERVLKKYFIDKEITITPAGLIIRKAKEEGVHRGFSIYDNNVVDLSKVSSGERKIIIIFAVGIFFNKLIMLDEPELSLSLVWQESILQDLLDECGDDLIVATHSPYIVNNDSVKGYIQYLP